MGRFNREVNTEMRENKPPPRLRDFAVGQTVVLAGVEVPMRISAVRPDGYIDLTDKGRLRVTASACHLCSEAKK